MVFSGLWPFLTSSAVMSSMPNQMARRPPSRHSGSRSWFLKTSNSVASVPKKTVSRKGLPWTLPLASSVKISSTVSRLLKKLSSVPKKWWMPVRSARTVDFIAQPARVLEAEGELVVGRDRAVGAVELAAVRGDQRNHAGVAMDLVDGQRQCATAFAGCAAARAGPGCGRVRQFVEVLHQLLHAGVDEPAQRGFFVAFAEDQAGNVVEQAGAAQAMERLAQMFAAAPGIP